MFFIGIDRKSDQSLSHQIYSNIRERILQGQLKGGHRLPASRTLGEELMVSRNVVLSAYDQLYAEGYLETRQGNGSFVAEGLHSLPEHEDPFASLPVPVPPMTLSGFDSTLIDFRSGLPDLNLFPRQRWLGHYRSVMDHLKTADLAYGPPEGRLELRQSISEYLKSARGLHCDPGQILITSGTTQAISLITKLILSSGKKQDVVLEDPITADISRIIELNGAVCHHIPINQKGLDVRDIPDELRPGFCYVTPSHQYPLGGTMSISRRIRLIEYSRSKDCFILEDDYDSEFRFDVQPLQPLYELDKNRVIYCGTFSKTLCPALRTAYLILPPALMETTRRLKWYADLHNATLDQLVLSRFINSGDYVRHLGKMKKRYKSRRSILIKALSHHFPDSIEILGAAAGLHLCVRFPGRIFDRQTILELRGKGLLLYPAAVHSHFPAQYEDTLIFGYGILPPQKMEEGITILRESFFKFPGPLLKITE